MVVQESKQKISEVKFFRQNMGMSLTKDKIEEFWGKGLEVLGEPCVSNSKIVDYKVGVVKDSLEKLLMFDWVKFIGITGSVACGNVKESDDVDVFIVVKNNRSWLYRGLLVFRLGFNSVRRVWGKCYRDKIDTNFICEERGLSFDTKSIFVLHELMYMIPAYNEDYYQDILSFNHLLFKNFGIQIPEKVINRQKHPFLIILNYLAFIFQCMYMFFAGHKPDIRRLNENNKMGRIEFFPKGFQIQKIREYEKLKRKPKKAL